RALRQATRLIVTTTATADRVRAVAPLAAPRLHVIQLAPDSCFRRPADLDAARQRAAALNGNEAPYLLVVGQNSAAKRHGDAIAAFAAGVPRPWRLGLLQRQGASVRRARLARARPADDRIGWRPGVAGDDGATCRQ